MQLPQITDETVLIGFCTVPTDEVGKKIAHSLVSQRLVACVNLAPGLTSIYWWEGKINQDPELLLMIKTTFRQKDTVITAIKAIHPYQVPEIVFWPLFWGNLDYLSWVQTETRS